MLGQVAVPDSVLSEKLMYLIKWHYPIMWGLNFPAQLQSIAVAFLEALAPLC